MASWSSSSTPAHEQCAQPWHIWHAIQPSLDSIYKPLQYRHSVSSSSVSEDTCFDSLDGFFDILLLFVRLFLTVLVSNASLYGDEVRMAVFPLCLLFLFSLCDVLGIGSKFLGLERTKTVLLTVILSVVCTTTVSIFDTVVGTVVDDVVSSAVDSVVGLLVFSVTVLVVESVVGSADGSVVDVVVDSVVLVV